MRIKLNWKFANYERDGIKSNFNQYNVILHAWRQNSGSVAKYKRHGPNLKRAQVTACSTYDTLSARVRTRAPSVGAAAVGDVCFQAFLFHHQPEYMERSEIKIGPDWNWSWVSLSQSTGQSTGFILLLVVVVVHFGYMADEFNIIPWSCLPGLLYIFLLLGLFLGIVVFCLRMDRRINRRRINSRTWLWLITELI